MDIPQGIEIGVIVRGDWARLNRVRRIIGRPDREGVPSDNSHLVIAPVLDDNDKRGLWIELNRKRHCENPALAVPLATTGCATRSRYYDPYYRDYHRWNQRDDRAYRRYQAERHERYREFSRRSREEQREYWRWRHEHRDNDMR